MLRPDSEEIWIPLANEPQLQPQAHLVTVRGAHWLYAIGRLRQPDLELRPIEARLTSVLQQWLQESPDLPAEFAQQIPSQAIQLVSAASGVTGLRGAVGPSLRVLLAIAGSVLLIACANLANLLLARGMGRRTEMAVRAALGASRSRLVVGSIVESVVLACLGGGLGLIVAYAGARLIVSQAFRGAAYVPIHATPSPLVLAFTFGISLITGIAFGLVPAMLESGARAGDALRGVGRVAGDRGASLRRSLVAIQVALSLGLMACAGLLGRSLINLQQQDFGFRPDSRVIARLGITLGPAGFDRLESIYQRLSQSLEQIPGVARAGFALYAPLEGNNWSSQITIEGHVSSERLGASWNRVSPRFFETIGVPIVRGRMITEHDRDGQAVAVVNQTFAAKFFPGGDAIGRHFGMADGSGGGAQDYEIVGIVADARFQDARRPAFAMFFLPFLQPAPHLPESAQGADRRSNYAGRLALHLTQEVPHLDEQIRRAVAAVDPALTVQRVVRLDEQIALNFNNDRLIATLSAIFGGMALLLACLGLYGVTAYNVERRTREIGIRIAVGASRGRVLNSVLRSALLHALVGIAAGIPLALLGGRLLQNQLFGVSGRDPWMLALASLILGACSAGAAFIPAWRAATTDPIRALRTD